MSVHDLLAINKESACELFGSVSYITQTLILILLIREMLEELSIIQLEKGKTEKQKKGKLYVADNSKTPVFQGWLLYLVDFIEVKAI